MPNPTRQPRRRTAALALFLLPPLVSLGLFSPAAAAPSPTPGTGGSALVPHAAVTPNSLAPVVTDTGLISLSENAVGSFVPTGAAVAIDKPQGATVRAAYVAAATTGVSGATLANGDVQVDGAGVSWTQSTPNDIGSTNYWSDVTSLVKPKLDVSAAGTVSFQITETNTSNVDGEILAVIFDDPNQKVSNTITLLFGAQLTGGDTFTLPFGSPIDKSSPNLTMDLGLGISFSYQGSGDLSQYSTVDINGQRLTSAAGGQDDGAPANGALITVGGVGDSDANPLDPNATPTGDPRFDDELYNLLPFVKTGDTQAQISTQNPPANDNMFFAALDMNGVMNGATTGRLPLTVASSQPALPDGIVGQSYTGGLYAFGGTTPYTWSITGGRLPTGLTLNAVTGAITGTPAYAGTLNFTAAVTDSSSPPQSASSVLLPLTILSSQVPPGWHLQVGQEDPPPSGNTPPRTVIPNPHVAFVLVGNWWCSLFSPSSTPPKNCKRGSTPTAPVEQSNFVAAVSSLVKNDYSSEYGADLSRYYQVTGCGIFNIGCTTTYVGNGVALRSYSPFGGTVWGGPLSSSDAKQNLATKLTELEPGFGMGSQSDVNDTIFVLLYAPNELPKMNQKSCNNPSKNGPLGGFNVAYVYLEDSQSNCPGDVQLGLGSLIDYTQFATYATSHELDENITDPTSNASGWSVSVPGLQTQQIADVCEFRNSDGETQPLADTAFPFRNYTRDSLGTVVAPYVGPTNPAFCHPDVASGIPPK
jgi:Putative Ig domain